MRRVLFLAFLFVVAFSASPQWKIVSLNFATIAIDIAFVSDTAGICAIANNGQGSAVMATSNGGQKWNAVPGPPSLLYLGAAAQNSSSGRSGVVCGTLDTQYSHAPKGWNFTLAEIGLESQNADDFGDGMSYGVVGSTLKGGEGCSVSTNYGQHFTFYNVSELQTIARYGAFPSATTWYISAGQWPGGAAAREAWRRGDGSIMTRQMTKRLHYHYNKESGKYSHSFHTGELDTPANNFEWQAQIVKTADGGKTWQTMFYNHSHYYFNQIACGTENNCVAAAESDSKSSAGVWLFTTADGGTTWKNTMYMTGNAYSVVATEFVSQTEVWAGGCELGAIGPKFAYFWHSTDSGNTWTLIKNVKGVYPIATSFADPAHGFAVGPNFEDQSSFLSYS